MIEIEDVIEPTPTSEASRKINAIDKETVHKICSGQVVLSLAIAVKELIENAIDAGATVVEVKLKEHGADLVEVCDNGSGVEERNFIGLTAKYHTSKLREFSDLASIETFGFRGEALSSLCALSDMVIVTKHETASHGTKLELNHNGEITRKSPCARSTGTTVSLTNLFSTLPVRRKEFQKNIKREFIKMCQILQAYCLVSVGVRVICTNHSKKSGKTIIMSTQGTGTVIDNISTVFGSKQTLELVPLKPAIGRNGKIIDLNESDFDDSISLTQEEMDNLNLSRYTIDGYISSCAHGSGRSSKDRQFFYVNSRPCEPKQIIKMVNETYHKYNPSQNPFVYLNLKMQRSEVDVNLTPDKRQILVNNEKILLLALKKSLLKTYGNIPSTYKMQNLDLSTTTRLLNISFASDNADDTDKEQDKSLTTPDTPNLSTTFNQWKASEKAADNSPRKPTTLKRKREELPKISSFLDVGSNRVSQISRAGSHDDNDDDELKSLPKIACRTTLVGGSESDNIADHVDDSNDAQRKVAVAEPQEADIGRCYEKDFCKKLSVTRCINKIPVVGPVLKFENILSPNKEKESESNSPQKQTILESITVEDASHHSDESLYGNRSVQIDLPSLAKLIEQEKEIAEREEESRKCSLSRLKFKSKINPASNRSAEDELQMEISKDKFAQMEIIGQFNLGFIIARLDLDLFIIDQHATDEKYNFEDLQRTTILQNQKLVVPQQLELTAVNEMILMDNLEIFEMNGFKFELDGSAEPTRKVKLLAKPFSKNWEFGKEDIDELIFMLQDAPNTVCRPSRVRAMFASRACRKSVMIGKALSIGEMRKLVSHMGEIEQPWNCPHGRPTMRHLVNLSMIEQIEESNESKED
ncbi:mismatch repair endonuclease PMS2 [Uranotaenia lowii]|uniref:mismatch repair endonuclease PMS2 n=1 Tax=Uranotaenia lowii TaxID=190385 RepID=UPI002478FBE9|nr:mismatch repair endonuclease PMS2 [Uranotaenia lowii]